MTDPTYEDRARAHKVQQLAATLTTAGATAATVVHFTDADWQPQRPVCAVPSDATRAGVVYALEPGEAPTGDPFAGLDEEWAA